MTKPIKGGWKVIDLTPIGGGKYTVWCIKPEQIETVNPLQVLEMINAVIGPVIYSPITYRSKQAVQEWLSKFPKPVAE